MSEPKTHIRKIQANIDEVRAELKQMSNDGHLNNPEASFRAGAAQYEISELEEALKE